MAKKHKKETGRVLSKGILVIYYDDGSHSHEDKNQITDYVPDGKGDVYVMFTPKLPEH